MTFKQTNEKVEYVRDARGDSMGVGWKTSPNYGIKWDGWMDGWVDGWMDGGCDGCVQGSPKQQAAPDGRVLRYAGDKTAFRPGMSVTV